MEICYISYNYCPPDFGGELLISIDRLQSIAEHGHEVIALTSGRPGFTDHYFDKKIEVFRSPIIGKKRLSRLVRRLIYSWWLVRKLLSTQYDIYHLGGLGSPEDIYDALMTWLVTFFIHIKKKRCIYVHSLAETVDEAFVYRGWKRLAKEIYFKYITDIVSISPALHKEVSLAYPDKAHLIINGIQDHIYKMLASNEKEIGRAEFGLTNQDTIFTFLGSVGTRKGFDILAKAFSNLAIKFPHWKLWVIGPRTQSENANISEDEIQEISTPLNSVMNQVTWYGRIDDRKYLAKLLAYSNVFVFPSRREGMGLAPLEAMAAGIPVIISRIKGVTDLANIEGETGMYISPGDVNELEQAMKRLGEDADLRNKMGIKANQIIKEEFGWQAFIDKWERLYRDEFYLQ